MRSMNTATETWNIRRSGTRSEVWIHHNDKFVARFKYAGPGKKATHFVKFLTKHFTPSEYFEALAKHGTPLETLRAKGYELPSFNR
jgi:hypothetical protein